MALNTIFCKFKANLLVNFWTIQYPQKAGLLNKLLDNEIILFRHSFISNSKKMGDE